MALPFNPATIAMPVPIITPRLVIRPVMPGDGPAMTEAKLETLDRLNPWLPFAAHTPSVTEDEDTVRAFHDKFVRREDFMLVGMEKTTGRPVAYGGLHPIDWDRRIFSTGYWVRKSAHGKRYASEMNNALLRYAFAVLGARRMEIFHAEGNLASESVIRRLGYTPDGIAEKPSVLNNGHTVSRRAYVRTNTDNLPRLRVRW